MYLTLWLTFVHLISTKNINYGNKTYLPSILKRGISQKLNKFLIKKEIVFVYEDSQLPCEYFLKRIWRHYYCVKVHTWVSNAVGEQRGLRLRCAVLKSCPHIYIYFKWESNSTTCNLTNSSNIITLPRNNLLTDWPSIKNY